MSTVSDVSEGNSVTSHTVYGSERGVYLHNHSLNAHATKIVQETTALRTDGITLVTQPSNNCVAEEDKHADDSEEVVLDKIIHLDLTLPINKKKRKKREEKKSRTLRVHLSSDTSLDVPPVTAAAERQHIATEVPPRMSYLYPDRLSIDLDNLDSLRMGASARIPWESDYSPHHSHFGTQNTTLLNPDGTMVTNENIPVVPTHEKTYRRAFSSFSFVVLAF